MDGQYILVGQTPVECPDLLTWGRWMEENDRRVKLTRVGPVHVSTIFMGLDHSWSFVRRSLVSGIPIPDPILFETMAWVEIPPPHQNCECLDCRRPREFLDLQERCATWPEAEVQHAAVVAQLVAENPGDQVEELEHA